MIPGQCIVVMFVLGFPGGSDGKESAWDTGDLGWEGPLEKEMTTHSSSLACRIPWTERHGKLQSKGIKPRGSGWRGRWEGGSGWGTHVNPWLFYSNV